MDAVIDSWVTCFWMWCLFNNFLFLPPFFPDYKQNRKSQVFAVNWYGPVAPVKTRFGFPSCHADHHRVLLALRDPGRVLEEEVRHVSLVDGFTRCYVSLGWRLVFRNRPIRFACLWVRSVVNRVASFLFQFSQGWSGEPEHVWRSVSCCRTWSCFMVSLRLMELYQVIRVLYFFSLSSRIRNEFSMN